MYHIDLDGLRRHQADLCWSPVTTVVGLQIRTETCGRDSSRANQTCTFDLKYHRLQEMPRFLPGFWQISHEMVGHWICSLLSSNMPRWCLCWLLMPSYPGYSLAQLHFRIVIGLKAFEHVKWLTVSKSINDTHETKITRTACDCLWLILAMTCIRVQEMESTNWLAP